MPNPYFQFKQFTVFHDRCSMKVTTDACLFGAWVAKAINGNEHPKTFLDIGTGTGLLSLMLAQQHNTRIDAVEIDPEAAAQAKENVHESPWGGAIRVVTEDVLQWSAQRMYDGIVSNPPFYENEIRSATSAKNTAHHDAGLKLSVLFPFIKSHLNENGMFFLLLPAKRKTEIESLLKKNNLFIEQMVLVKQTLKHLPFRLMIQGRHQAVERIRESTIIIAGDDGVYSPVFADLLRPYYLYL